MSCIYLSYLHCSDFVYLVLTSIILVLLIFVDFGQIKSEEEEEEAVARMHASPHKL